MYFFNEERQPAPPSPEVATCNFSDYRPRTRPDSKFLALLRNAVIAMDHTDQDGGLRKNIGRAAACRMERITFEFDRPAIDGGGDERNRTATRGMAVA